VGRDQEHRARAADALALAVAQALRPGYPAWALVPLFYSAMHLMHARFDADGLPADQRHPQRHNSQRDSSGIVIKWGTLDVVVMNYRPPVSRAYKSLFSASRVVRYDMAALPGDGARFWTEYQVISNVV
jgi:hypothetical protein